MTTPIVLILVGQNLPSFLLSATSIPHTKRFATDEARERRDTKS